MGNLRGWLYPHDKLLTQEYVGTQEGQVNIARQIKAKDTSEKFIGIAGDSSAIPLTFDASATVCRRTSNL